MKCPNCGKDIEEKRGISYCPYCGQSLEARESLARVTKVKIEYDEAKSKSKEWGITGSIAMLAALATVILIPLSVGRLCNCAPIYFGHCESHP